MLPFVAGPAGCVVIAILFATPALSGCDTVAVEYPVALTIIVLFPDVCKSVAGTEADGVNVIAPAETEYPAVRAVPLTVTPVIAD